MKFQVDCPIQAASLVLLLLDMDSLGDPEPIYDPVVIPLDHHIRLSYIKERDFPHSEPLGIHKRNIIFDSWPKGTKSTKISCCPCCNSLVDPTPASLACEIQVVPKKFADEHPVGTAREAPMPLPEATGRLDWYSLFSDPVGLFVSVMGPQSMVYCAWGCCFLILFMLIFFVLMVMYFGVSTVVQIKNN